MKAPRLRALSGLLAALLIGPLAGSVEAQAPREIVIGVIYPLSGNLAQIGIDSVTAIRMATDIYNGRSELNLPSARKATDGLPGLGGARVRLIVVDHQGKPELGQAEAERLITQEKVTRADRLRALERHRHREPGGRALRRAVHERGVVLAHPHRARIQVVLPHLAARRPLQPGDVRLHPETSRRSAASR